MCLEINNFFSSLTTKGAKFQSSPEIGSLLEYRQGIEFCEPCFFICEIEPREGHDRIIVGIKGLDYGERLVQMRPSCSYSTAPWLSMSYLAFKAKCISSSVKWRYKILTLMVILRIELNCVFKVLSRVDGPGDCPTDEVSEKEKSKDCILMHMWNLEKWCRCSYLQRRNRHTDIEIRHMDTKREKEGGSEMN